MIGILKGEVNQHFIRLQNILVEKNSEHKLSDAQLMVKVAKLQKLEDNIMVCLEKSVAL